MAKLELGQLETSTVIIHKLYFARNQYSLSEE